MSRIGLLPLVLAAAQVARAQPQTEERDDRPDERAERLRRHGMSEGRYSGEALRALRAERGVGKRKDPQT